ncbi:hypothetical protein [uncultured Aquimarina sp.]|uniref:hypothetical protein n=1 Tax=uncultured Aquimarina sp. TaxID=575652 RepID=UPI00262EB6E7|nr:hypothetical protein [uncultured Aquimarina sp.]
MKFLILIVFLNGCASIGTYKTTSYEEDDYTKVSIDKILENPNLYHEKKIELNGYFFYGLEEAAITNDKSSSVKQRIWIDFDYKKNLLDNNNNELFAKNKLLDCSNKKIKIKGVFSKENKGHLGIYIGALTNITYFGDEK